MTKTNNKLRKNLKFYNTMSRTLELFVPISQSSVGLYTCGPTVYSRAHIGNFRAYIFADTLKRTLFAAGYKVNHVMNITDVGELSGGDDGQDKMLLGAKKENITAWQVAEKYTKLFVQDRRLLNILPPSITCKATDHVKEQIDLVKRLEENGYTYKTDDGVYFDTSKLDDYGKLAKLDIKGLEAGARIEMGQKKNKTDFALWKFSTPGENRDMEWDSPWGKGFPGWHIECSAMSMKYLGEQFDIHTGGIDHIPIHHTNEIAQSEGATNKKPFVKYWMHLNFLKFGEDKMSKSLGNIKDIDQLEVDGIKPMAFRYLCLGAKYRQPLNASSKAFKSAKESYEKLVAKVREIVQNAENSKESNFDDEKKQLILYKKQFYDAIADDLNTPIALSVLWGLVKDKKVSTKSKLGLMYEFDQILGLGLENIKSLANEVPDKIWELAKKRQELKNNKQWEESDKIRKNIESKGYLIEDNKNGFSIIKKEIK